jgi:hypothetical protein
LGNQIVFAAKEHVREGQSREQGIAVLILPYVWYLDGTIAVLRFIVNWRHPVSQSRQVQVRLWPLLLNVKLALPATAK